MSHAAATIVLALAAGATQAQGTCSVRSAASVTPLVELYTSEGCSSCPPADQWASRALRGGAVVAAFHVHYWDQLGWRDRFASPAFTERQARERAVNGAAYSYTPQVVIGGRDRPDWHRVATLPAGQTPALVAVELARDARGASATVQSLPGAPARLAGWWAVVEDGHASAVAAGENGGRTLRHDAVVREHRPIAAWNGDAARPAALAFEPSTPTDSAHPRRIVLVVTDAASGRPLQTVQVGC